MTHDQRILIVDDQPANIQVLHAALKGVGTVQFATSGGQALDHAGSNPPDLVLLDVNMPEMDGFEVCRRLKGDAATEHAVVVMVSGTADADSVQTALDAGAEDFIEKSQPAALIRKRVEGLLELQALRGGARVQASAGDAGQGPLNVLVIEDGEINRMILWEMLAAQNHKATMALSAEEGLVLFEERGFDCVLLDIHLPGMDGIQAAKRIRAKDGDGTRIIAVTGDVAPGTRAQYAEAGFDAVVRKPIEPDLLFAAIDGSGGAFDDDAPMADVSQSPDLLIDKDRMATLKDTYPAARMKGLYDLFEREVEGYLATLAKVAQDGDLDAVAATAHRLKSALGHFACSRMGAVAADLSQRGRHNAEEAGERVRILEALFPETLVALKGALDV